MGSCLCFYSQTKCTQCSIPVNTSPIKLNDQRWNCFLCNRWWCSNACVCNASRGVVVQKLNVNNCLWGCKYCS